MSSHTSEVVFEYTGFEDEVPEDVTCVHFHSSVPEVAEEMFKNCWQLKKVILNEGLQKIGNRSFYECRSLESITLPSTVLEVGSFAFYYCCNLAEIVLNEGLKEIGKSAFYGCISLKSITLPSTITEVGAYCFSGCSDMESIIFKKTLQTVSVGRYAFSRCISLEHITVPLTITSIDDAVFANCIRLSEVGLHEGIQKVAPNAFSNCSSLEKFKFPDLSARLDSIIRAGQTEAGNKLDEIRNIIERRGCELMVPVVSVQSPHSSVQHSNWVTLRGILGQIDRLIAYYELREATTLFELAMWKSKMDEEENVSINNRNLYRIDIPGPVKNTILQYLN